jgi:hypothetical protein
MADVTIDFVTDVTYDTVKRLKMASNYPPYRHTNIQQHSRYYSSPDLEGCCRGKFEPVWRRGEDVVKCRTFYSWRNEQLAVST